MLSAEAEDETAFYFSFCEEARMSGCPDVAPAYEVSGCFTGNDEIDVVVLLSITR